jgi:hypothetical protein
MPWGFPPGTRVAVRSRLRGRALDRGSFSLLTADAEDRQAPFAKRREYHRAWWRGSPGSAGTTDHRFHWDRAGAAHERRRNRSGSRPRRPPRMPAALPGCSRWLLTRRLAPCRPKPWRGRQSGAQDSGRVSLGKHAGLETLHLAPSSADPRGPVVDIQVRLPRPTDAHGSGGRPSAPAAAAHSAPGDAGA